MPTLQGRYSHTSGGISPHFKDNNPGGKIKQATDFSSSLPFLFQEYNAAGGGINKDILHFFAEAVPMKHFFFPNFASTLQIKCRASTKELSEFGIGGGFR